eukprot:TRINITY_DN11416_c0_g1_i1.p1 TRINITY_DN11416_c0_g1~~TRINITY_DN11416_c0_g1_i1.p1  ORF type:complete len:191 (-),score=43.49 TRINITY_DN11416_c0_g1_i1:53-625(-)
MSVVYAFLCFIALTYAQGSIFFFPDAVKFVNSDFNQTGSTGLGFGHFDFLSNQMHIIVSAQGFSVEEWVQFTPTDMSVFALMNGECNAIHVPLPAVTCSGWQQAGTVYTQTCSGDAGGSNASVEISVNVINGQPSWLKQVVTDDTVVSTTTIVFGSTDAQPPNASTLTPPSDCGSSPNVRPSVHAVRAFI